MGVCKTDTSIIIVVVINIILLVAVGYAIKLLLNIVSTLEQGNPVKSEALVQTAKTVKPAKIVQPTKPAVSQAKVAKPESTGLSPKLVAVIAGAVAAYLDDQDMERHSISSITEVTP